MSPFKVESITVKDPYMFCYVSLPVKYITLYRPFDSAILKNPKNGLYAPVLVELNNKIEKGIELSEDLSRYLDVKVNSTVEIQKVYNIAPGNSIEIITKKLDSKEDDRTAPDLQNSAKKIKQMFRYCYVVDGYTFVKNNHSYTFKIRDVNKKYCHIVPQTAITVRTHQAGPSYSMMGLDKAYQTLKQMIEWPVVYPNQYNKLKIDTPKGVLLYGPSGCGKTHLIKQIAKNSNLKTYAIRGPQILSKYFGGSEQALRNTFEEAKKNQPSIILIDEIDSISKKRNDVGDTEARLVSQMLSCMDGLDERGNVIVIATTNFPNSIDSALRRPGRFDTQIEIKPPNANARKQLLNVFLKNVPTENLDLDQIAQRTNGYVNADLKLFCNEAKINVLRRQIERQDEEFRTKMDIQSKRLSRTQTDQEPEQDSELLSDVHDTAEKEMNLVLKQEDIEYAFRKVKPSMLRQYQSYETNVKLKDVIGYDQVKQRLIKEITFPIKYPEVFKRYNVKKIKGIILEGPPGTGKSTLAKALASEVNHNFIYLSPSQILSKYVGQTESKIQEIFQRARNSEPCVVFIDEIDGLFGNSRSLNTQSHQISKSTQFLSLMDGISSEEDSIFFIGTTNRLDLIDPAFVRAGRFELILRMDYPNRKELLELYEYYFREVVEPDTDFATLLSFSEKQKLTGSDMVAIKRLAMSQVLTQSPIEKMKQMESKVKPILQIDDIRKAIDMFLKYKYAELQDKTESQNRY